jgi:LysM repeat protein
MDGISHRNLSGVQYHKPQISHQIAKPQPARIETQPAQQQFKSDKIAQNQTDASQVQQANATDATSVIGDQAVGAGAQATTSTTYTIRAGDCLWNIAKNQMGDALKWQDIFNANKDILGSNPDLIQPGTTINLPGQEVAANQASNYVVKSGDSLWKISQDLLGDGSRWNELYQANASIIGENPRMIMPGQELTIPGMDGADTLAQAGSAGAQSAQAAGQAGQQTLQSATQVPAGDAQQAFSAQPQGMEAQSMQTQSAPQEMPQIQDRVMQAQPSGMQSVPQSGAGAANAMPQAQAQPAAYQPQAPTNYQPLPAANLPADKNAVVSSTMVPTDIVEMFRKAK